jgi:hypothetical protein
MPCDAARDAELGTSPAPHPALFPHRRLKAPSRIVQNRYPLAGPRTAIVRFEERCQLRAYNLHVTCR